jgi:N-acetylmuramoyl-L-alanine amidase
LAAATGFFVLTLWQHGANAGLRARRANMDILLPGDVVTIPDKRIAQVDAATDQRHRFKRRGVPSELRLQLFFGELPRANEAYLLTVGNVVFDGTTDGQGVLFHHVPPGTREAQLVIGPQREKILLKFGTLDPDDLLSGVQKRLANLGFDAGPPTGQMNEDTRAALLAFQRRFALEATGEADAATQSRLKEFNDALAAFPARPPEPLEDWSNTSA